MLSDRVIRGRLQRERRKERGSERERQEVGGSSVRVPGNR